MSKEWGETLADIHKHSCKVCGIYKCQNHPPEEWVICPGCPESTKYWLKFHAKCPSCGALPPVAQERK